MLHSKTGITCDTSHRESIHRIVAWNGDNANSIRHHYVFSLANDVKPGFLQSLDGIEVIDARNLRHGLDRYLHFADVFAFDKIVYSH